MRRGDWDERVEMKQREAKIRKEYRESISALDQIARLDRRLGFAVGAKKERARLYKEVLF